MNKCRSLMVLALALGLTAGLLSCGGSTALPPGDGSTSDPENPGPVDPTLVSEGEELFSTVIVPDFGSVGCAFCHCPDATGGCNFGAPRIIGKPRSPIANALQTVDQMAGIELTAEEIDAIAAYLSTL